jgi:hypothetical protein
MRRALFHIVVLCLMGVAAWGMNAQAQTTPTSAGRQAHPAKPKAEQAAPAPAPKSALEETPEPGQPRRLILKDGSYQQTVRWERKGDRIRYLSAERYEWEELPASLVDWQATEKYAKELASGALEAKEADAEEAAERAREAAAKPEVAPGIRLPGNRGVYLLDVYGGEPQLVELTQSGGEINQNRGGNILRAVVNPLAKVKQSIELKGLHAAVQSHVSQPAIYVNVEPPEKTAKDSQGTDETEQFRIVRLRPKKEARELGVIEIAIYGKVTQKQNLVETQSEPVTSDWVKITPAVPLEPGEYAVVEMMGKDVNLYVWDFGVNPTAPENPTAWRPAPVEKAPDVKQPEVQPRPKD